MIDEKDLIMILEEKAKVESLQGGVITYEGDIHSGGVVEGIRWSIEAVKEQPKTCEWIPVSERLPGADERYVLVYAPISCCPIYVAFLKEEEWVALTDPLGDFKFEQEDVVAWMPLPEPWEGEK